MADFINKRRLGVTIIIIGLMIILFSTGRRLENKLKNTTLIQNDLSSFTEYKIEGTGYSYKLPVEWEAHESKIGGEEIIYHNEFVSEDNKVHGLVQLWRIKTPLNSFLKKSKSVSEDENIIKNYKIKKTMFNNKKGYIITYLIIDKYDNSYNCREYFIQDKDGFIRFSFFIINKYYKENMCAIFDSIVNTLKVE